MDSITSALRSLSPAALLVITASTLFLFKLARIYVISNDPPLPGPGFLGFISDKHVRAIFRDPQSRTQQSMHLSRKYGQVFGLWSGTSRTIVVSNPADIAQICSSGDIFHRSDIIRRIFNLIAPGGIFGVHAAKHHAIRKTMRDRFNPQMLAGFQLPITTSLAELLDRLGSAADSGEVVDLPQLTAVANASFILNAAFGGNLQREERQEFLATLNPIFVEMGMEFVFMPFRTVFERLGARKRMNDYVNTARRTARKVVHRRLQESKKGRESRNLDLLDTLLSLGEPEDAVTSLTFEFVMAGTDTTAQATGWLLYEALCAPHVMDKLTKEIQEQTSNLPPTQTLTMHDIEKFTYVQNAWKEVLRVHPPVPTVSRTASMDVTLRGSGTRVPKGTEVQGNIYHNHMSPEIWKNAHEFQPERWDCEANGKPAPKIPIGAYAPFQMGIYGCPGRFLADVQGPLLVAEVLRWFDIKLACTTSEIVPVTLFADAMSCTNKAMIDRFGKEVSMPITLRRRF